MQAGKEALTSFTTAKDGSLKHKRVKDMLLDRRLVEVPYNATLTHTMNALVANKVAAVPVAAPPGQWIGAGGSMIMECDKATGAVRKHYIGMVTMLDILARIAGSEDPSDLDRVMAVPVSSIIGHHPEGLSLWTLNSNTSVLDCMEVFSKGVHRALVPMDSQMQNTVGVELVDSSSSYRMLTQMDVIRFLENEDHATELQSILSINVEESGAVNRNAFSITATTKLIDAINSMRAALLNAVPIVEDHHEEEAVTLVDGIGKKLVGTFSATDLKGCHLATLATWLPLTAIEFTEGIRASAIYAPDAPARELVTCYGSTPLGEIIRRAACKHVHRVWVVDRDGLLVGIVSLTDIIRALRLHILQEMDGGRH